MNESLQEVNVVVEDTDEWITTSGTGKVKQAKRNLMEYPVKVDFDKSNFGHLDVVHLLQGNCLVSYFSGERVSQISELSHPLHKAISIYGLQR